MADDQVVIDEVVSDDVAPWVPDWQLDDDKPAQPVPLTEERLLQILAEQNKKSEDEPNFREEIINEATNKANQALDQKMATMMAPMARSGLAATVAKGLSDKAKDELEEYLSGYDANGIAALSKDKATLKLLRGFAENAHRTGGTAKTPRTEGTETVNTPVLDAKSEQDVKDRMAAWKDVPGMTEAKIREHLAKEVA